MTEEFSDATALWFQDACKADLLVQLDDVLERGLLSRESLAQLEAVSGHPVFCAQLDAEPRVYMARALDLLAALIGAASAYELAMPELTRSN